MNAPRNNATSGWNAFLGTILSHLIQKICCGTTAALSPSKRSVAVSELQNLQSGGSLEQLVIERLGDEQLFGRCTSRVLYEVVNWSYSLQFFYDLTHNTIEIHEDDNVSIGIMAGIVEYMLKEFPDVGIFARYWNMLWTHLLEKGLAERQEHRSIRNTTAGYTYRLIR